MLRHISYGEGPKSLAILIPTKDFNKEQIQEHYVDPLVARGLKKEEIIAFNLDHNAKGKAPVTLVVKPWLEHLEKALDSLNIKHILIAEVNYFKTICQERKAEPHYGYSMDTIWPGIRGYITTNYKALMFNPAAQEKINMSLDAVTIGRRGGRGLFTHKALQHARYPLSIPHIKGALNDLMHLPAVTVDIESYSLRVDKAKIATIAFGSDTKTAMAFPVRENQAVKEMLREFFCTYKGALIFHNATYDVKVIIWELFMKSPTDYRGMLKGLHTMFRNLIDTKVLAYLALNSTAGVSLKLKELAFEHTGNYAQDDIKDIIKIPERELLEYNATDAIATWFVYDKYRSQVRQEQEDPYQTVFRPSLKVLTQMELCGTPINMGAVLNAERKMDDIRRKHLDAILNNKDIKKFEELLRDKMAKKANLTLKKLVKTALVKTASDFRKERFNPNSDTQLAVLLHEYWGLPVLEKTDGGNPSTKVSVLRALQERVKRSRNWKGKHEVSKILNTFIPAFKANSIPKRGWHYLHGGFNLGGTKSGRLSSSDPNLQNIPSTGTQYAELIKACFQPPPLPVSGNDPGWIMVGADYASLEDRISALLTKDPEKLKVYTDGYDGHCLRAKHYFGDQMPDITDTVASINSIEKKYPKLRQDSKGPTFLLTYMGTWRGLKKSFGFSTIQAQEIEENYHELYKVSDTWVKERLKEAATTGYVELAFGLRLRTPVLTKVVYGSSSIPYQAHQEEKTAGNALGQSYGLLNSHSANLFMQRVWNSKYAECILPAMQVHDSQYYMVRNTLECLKWVNDNLIDCMEWNKLAPIQHPTVKLAANLELYHPNWNHKISLPNYTSRAKLRKTVDDGIAAQK
jgi:DNA polymerase-1